VDRDERMTVAPRMDAMAVAFTPEPGTGVDALRGSLRRYWRSIVSCLRWPMHHQLEGIDNKIKMVRRNAYGWRDSDYFFL